MLLLSSLPHPPSLTTVYKIVAVNYSPFEKPIHAAVNNNIIKPNLTCPWIGKIFFLKIFHRELFVNGSPNVYVSNWLFVKHVVRNKANKNLKYTQLTNVVSMHHRRNLNRSRRLYYID